MVSCSKVYKYAVGFGRDEMQRMKAALSFRQVLDSRTLKIYIIAGTHIKNKDLCALLACNAPSHQYDRITRMDTSTATSPFTILSSTMEANI